MKADRHRHALPLLGLLLLVLLQVCTATGARGDPVAAIQGLIGRVLGPDYVHRFEYQVIPADSATGNDVFELSYAAGRPFLRGNTGVSMASALNFYLKYYCYASITWGVNGTGDQLKLPSPLPRVPATVRVVSPVKYRYYMNVCTVSYSSAWWDITRWQREIDWMALNGINLPLSFTGQEYVWYNFWTQVGFNDAQIMSFFAGPAFLAWGRMGNIMGWGGPLDATWRNSQMQLQLQILNSTRLFGMTPVLPGFAGFVPSAFQQLFPTAKLQRSAQWGRFNDSYSRVFLLEPTDPLFNKLGTLYYRTLIAIYGTDHVYNADTYNEMEPSSKNPAFLKASNQAVYQAMTSVDPQAIFLMQGWLFHEDFWGQSEIKAYLSGVPDSKMIILDLNSEQQPLWNSTQFFYGKPFIWCMLHNYGGNRGIYGDMPVVATGPLSAKATPGTTMIGTGMTMEAIEQNPIIYDLMAEMGWRSESFDLTQWIQDYAHRRYGSVSASASLAWKVLQSTVYRSGWNWNIQSTLQRAPDFGISSDQSKNATAITVAWRLLYKASEEFRTLSGPYYYDLVDVTRQSIENLFFDLYQQVQPEYNRWQNQRVNTTVQLTKLRSAMLTLIKDLDTLLASNPNYLLGKWIDDARLTGNTPQEKANREYNARNQVTMWGPDENINDYAGKAWAGLVGDYYAGRWQLFMRELVDAVESGVPLNFTQYKFNRWRFESAWDASTNSYPSTPTGDTLLLVGRLLNKYAACNPPSCAYQRMSNKDVRGHDLMNGVQTWTKDVAQLQFLCDVNPDCVGFNTNGYLKTASGPQYSVPAVDLFLKVGHQ